MGTTLANSIAAWEPFNWTATTLSDWLRDSVRSMVIFAFDSRDNVLIVSPLRPESKEKQCHNVDERSIFKAYGGGQG